jgi:small nuclear ribonucleoprotein (snRNP)-like protein
MLNELKNKLVKITYRDGEKVKAVYGILEDFDDKFITIRYKDGRIVSINLNEIVRISSMER